jgi:hypothetical protein
MSKKLICARNERGIWVGFGFCLGFLGIWVSQVNPSPTFFFATNGCLFAPLIWTEMNKEKKFIRFFRKESNKFISLGILKVNFTLQNSSTPLG